MQSVLNRVFIVVVVFALQSSSEAADNFRTYAAPNAWGPSTRLVAHLGQTAYRISYRAIGPTKVTGRVTYYSTDGTNVTREFNGSITFVTEDAVGQPTVEFRGVPFGAAVLVKVE